MIMCIERTEIFEKQQQAQDMTSIYYNESE